MWVDPVGLQTMGGEISSDEFDCLPRLVYRCELDHVDILTLQQIQYLAFCGVKLLFIDGDIPRACEHDFNRDHSRLLLLNSDASDHISVLRLTQHASYRCGCHCDEVAWILCSKHRDRCRNHFARNWHRAEFLSPAIEN